MTFVGHLRERPAIHLALVAALLVTAWALPGPATPLLLVLPALAYLAGAARALDCAVARPAAVEARLAAGAMPWEALTLAERGPSPALTGAALACVAWILTAPPTVRPWMVVLVVFAALLGRLIAMLRSFVGNRLVDRLPPRL